MEFLGHVLLVGVLFLLLDSIWLKFVANKFYKEQLGDMLKEKPRMLPAGIFYVIYMTAIVVFAVNPALGEGSVGYAAAYGAFLGLALYATYDLTNLSTLKRWPVKVTVVDILWGTFATKLTAIVAFLILS